MTFIYCLPLSSHLMVLEIDLRSKVKVLIAKGPSKPRFWIVVWRIWHWWIILKIQLDLFHLDIDSFIILFARTSKVRDDRRRCWRANFKRSIIGLLGGIRTLIIEHSPRRFRQPHLIRYITDKFGDFDCLWSLVSQTISLFFLAWKAAALCDSIWFVAHNGFILETLHFWTLHLILRSVGLSKLLSFDELTIVVFIFFLNQLHFYNYSI